MDAGAVARKLQPLMPKQVRHWLAVRESADPQLKQLIDQQIFLTARRKLGDLDNKPLLSLPPRNLIAGAYQLGMVVYEKPKWPAGLRPSELIQGIGIYGRSGAGKTNLVFNLLKQLEARRVPWLFLDWKRTARHLLPLFTRPVQVYTPGRSLSPFPFNPFIAPPGLEARVYVGQVVDAMAAAYTLGEGARRLLHKALVSCLEKNASPTVEQLLLELEAIEDKERVRGWKISAIRALETLVTSGAVSGQAVTQEQLTRTLVQESTILELDGLSHSTASFLVPLLLSWIFYLMISVTQREKLRLLIVLEEAHHVLYRQERRSKESLVNTLLRQCRELGIGFLIVDQHPHLISSAALGNCFASVCLNLKDPADIAKAAAMSLLEEQEKRFLSKLVVGEGIVKLQDRWQEPFVIQIPLVSHHKGAMTDQLLRDYIDSHGKSIDQGNLGTGSAQAWGSYGLSGQVPRFPLLDAALDEGSLAFVSDVLTHPDDGVKQRYKRLGLSGSRGDGLKRRLSERGWLEGQVIPMGRTRKLVLRLTASGQAALGFEQAANRFNHAANPHESIAHAYFKRVWAHRLERQGYQVQLEAARTGGKVDVLATLDGKGSAAEAKSIAVEVETGQGDVLSNVRNCLRSGFTQVLVVATSRRAFDAIERKLAKAGLLIQGRVKLLLAHAPEPHMA